MSLLELMAALALFAIILGSLMMILNSATSLWSGSHTRDKELSAAQDIRDLISDDLRHAMVDAAPDKNAPPSFVLDSPPSNPAPDTVYVFLRFTRQPGTAPASLSTTADPALSVQSIYYTFFNSAIYRHVVSLPFVYDGVQEIIPLGRWLDECANQLDPDLHRRIFDRAKIKVAPSAPVEPTSPASCQWTCSLLAENASIQLRAMLPSRYARPTSEETLPRVIADKLSDSLEYKHLEADVLPDRIDLAVGVRTEESLNNPPLVASGADYQSCSQRITFPAQGGSRLP